MRNGIQQHLPIHDVDVKMLSPLNGRFMMEVAVQQPHQIGFAHHLIFTERLRHDGEGVRDPIFGIGERQLSDRG